MNTLYKDKNGNIHSVSPIQQPQDVWIELTKKEIEEHLNPIVPKEVVESNKRLERDNMINSFSWRLDRNSQELELGLENTDNRIELLEYMQYLRDIPNEEGFPYNTIKTYEEFDLNEKVEGAESWLIRKKYEILNNTKIHSTLCSSRFR